MKIRFKPYKIIPFIKKKEKLNFGYIDYLCYGKASGWAYSKEYKIKFISFYIGDSLIKRSEIKEVRDDINKLFNTDVETGFQLFFSVKDNISSNADNQRFVVEDSEKNKLFELDIAKEIKGRIKISEIINSEYYGYDGYIDGFNNQGLLTGWASARGKDNHHISIWLQSKGLDPQEIKCDKWLNDLSSNNISSVSSFEIDIKLLPSELSKRTIFFSFDKKGLCPLSGNNEIKLPEIKNNISIKKTEDNLDKELHKFEDNLQEFKSALNLLDKR